MRPNDLTSTKLSFACTFPGNKLALARVNQINARRQIPSQHYPQPTRGRQKQARSSSKTMTCPVVVTSTLEHNDNDDDSSYPHRAMTDVNPKCGARVFSARSFARLEVTTVSTLAGTFSGFTARRAYSRRRAKSRGIYYTLRRHTDTMRASARLRPRERARKLRSLSLLARQPCGSFVGAYYILGGLRVVVYYGGGWMMMLPLAAVEVL